MLEADIKARVLTHLLSKNILDDRTSIINEFTIDQHARRADLVLADDSKLVAFEIKSEADTLARLDGQVQKYLEYFDKVTVVTAPAHASKVMNIIPSNVAVWVLHDEGFKVIQRGKIKPVMDKNRLLDFVTVAELARLASKLGYTVLSKKRAALLDALQQASVTRIKAEALACLKERYGDTTAMFTKAVNSGYVTAGDLDLLSPFKQERLLLTKRSEQANSLWEVWKAVFEADPYLKILSKSEDGLLFGDIPKEVRTLVSA